MVRQIFMLRYLSDLLRNLQRTLHNLLQYKILLMLWHTLIYTLISILCVLCHISIERIELWYAIVTLIADFSSFQFYPFPYFCVTYITVFDTSTFMILKVFNLLNNNLYSGWAVSWIIRCRSSQKLPVKACLYDCGRFPPHLKVKTFKSIAFMPHYLQ